jgi:hypothetical protein
LIDLCVLTQTLVVDAEGIYDPRLLNDRLLLGLKGTMSEFELGILRQRAQEAYRQKVLRGEVLTKVPIGFIRHHHSNRIEMTPDREVQEAIRGVFDHFERFGTLRQVLLWHHQENIADAQKSDLCGRFCLWTDPMQIGRCRGAVAEKWRSQSCDGKLAALAKESSCGIYLLGAILGKPTYPYRESHQIPPGKPWSSEERQCVADRIVAMCAMREQTACCLPWPRGSRASLLLQDWNRRWQILLLVLCCI